MKLSKRTRATGDRKPTHIERQMRQAILDRNLGTVEVATAIGVEHSVISRFMGGRSLRSDTFGKLCEFLGLELRPIPNRKAKP
jgi:DNA-binding Xre family transcriptional regulator